MRSVSEIAKFGISVPGMPVRTMRTRSASFLAWRRVARCRFGPLPPVPSVPWHQAHCASKMRLPAARSRGSAPLIARVCAAAGGATRKKAGERTKEKTKERTASVRRMSCPRGEREFRVWRRLYARTICSAGNQFDSTALSIKPKGQRRFATEDRDASHGRDQREQLLVLIGKDGPQVDEHSVALDARDDRRHEAAQPILERVRRQAAPLDGDQPRRQLDARSAAAADG